MFFFVKQKTAYEMRISDWSSDVCSSDLGEPATPQPKGRALAELPTVFVLSGPNLNLLGTREPEIYGHDTLNDIHARLEAQAAELGLRLECRQTNHEGVLIDWLHEAYVSGAKRSEERRVGKECVGRCSARGWRVP